jgi:hypothetical protein
VRLGEMQKKLFRCSKELGFYNKLRKTLKHKGYLFAISGGKTDLFNKLIADLKENEDGVLDFEKLFGGVGKDYSYPVHTALRSKIHLSHLYSLAILQKCGLSHQELIDAFKLVTKEIFKKHKRYARFKEIIGYLRIFMR